MTDAEVSVRTGPRTGGRRFERSVLVPDRERDDALGQIGVHRICEISQTRVQPLPQLDDAMVVGKPLRDGGVHRVSVVAHEREIALLAGSLACDERSLDLLDGFAVPLGRRLRAAGVSYAEGRGEAAQRVSGREPSALLPEHQRALARRGRLIPVAAQRERVCAPRHDM